jgi:hypothetical protein
MKRTHIAYMIFVRIYVLKNIHGVFYYKHISLTIYDEFIFVFQYIFMKMSQINFNDVHGFSSRFTGDTVVDRFNMKN